MRLLTSTVLVALGLLVVSGCGQVAADQTGAKDQAGATAYPPLPDHPESLLECDKGAPVISATSDYAPPTGNGAANVPIEVAQAYAAWSLRPEFGDRFEVAGMNEQGDLAVLVLASAETVKDSVAQGNTAAVVTVAATDGVWAVTSSAACSRYVGGDQ